MIPLGWAWPSPATAKPSRAYRPRLIDGVLARRLAWLRDRLGDRYLGGVVLHTGPRSFRLGEGIAAAPIAALWS